LTSFTADYYRWRKEYGGKSRVQLKRLEELGKENQRLRRAVSDLTLDKLILTEAAAGSDRVLRSIVASLATPYPLHAWVIM
jgi:hypothetical protein